MKNKRLAYKKGMKFRQNTELQYIRQMNDWPKRKVRSLGKKIELL